MRAADARSGLPASMLIGVSATMVYGFAAATRHSEPTSLVFQIPRAGLTVKVHQRVNVRVLELIDNTSDTRIELEGNRLPVTHSKDVIHVLSGGALALSRAAPADVFPAIRRALPGCLVQAAPEDDENMPVCALNALSSATRGLPGGPARAGR